jgi:PHD/YefM family antitoxin component YafN of YafNO toxin-antitoxin module
MPDDDSHRPKAYDVTLIASNLPNLHEFVTRTLARVELTRPGSDERCVLISKEELASLERALEILSGTEDVEEIRAKITQLAAATGPAALASV